MMRNRNEYLCHFDGWNKRHDAWLRGTSVRRLDSDARLRAVAKSQTATTGGGRVRKEAAPPKRRKAASDGAKQSGGKRQRQG